jgi:hypothetical protein
MGNIIFANEGRLVKISFIFIKKDYYLAVLFETKKTMSSLKIETKSIGLHDRH